jgi:hypothetical protein
MPLEYLREGDTGFIGLNSRDNPSALPQGYVSKSQNFRLDKGVATVRKGLQRKTSDTIIDKKIYGTCVFLDLNGQENFVIAVTDGLYTYNPQTEIYSIKIAFPSGETIVDADIAPPNSNGVCDMVVAIDKIYISRGYFKRPLIATINTSSYVITSVAVAPTSGTGNAFPNCNGLLYFGNRLIATGQDYNLGYTPTPRARDSVCVSNYLDFNNWDSLDVFNINEGSNDETVALAPWSLNEFVVFMRHCIYYLNVGTGRYTYSDPLNSTASLRMLVSDMGCIAKRSIIQANGGIMFLSNNGVYFLNPAQVGANDATRLIANSKPLSAPVDDIIQRINKATVYRAVSAYWNNRYYLAVPIDGSADNNCVLIYNFILQAWESVDTYPAGFDIFSFAVGKKNDQRRLFGFDKDQGIFMFEELDYDEYGSGTGTPVLPFILPATLSSTSFTPNQIEGVLETRRYIFNSLREKRYSTLETEVNCFAGSRIKTYADVQNQDTYTLIDTYGSPVEEDSTRRNAIRKIGTGVQIKYITDNLRSSIYSSIVTATLLGKQNISKK